MDRGKDCNHSQGRLKQVLGSFKVCFRNQRHSEKSDRVKLPKFPFLGSYLSHLSEMPTTRPSEMRAVKAILHHVTPGALYARIRVHLNTQPNGRRQLLRPSVSVIHLEPIVQ